MYLNVYVPRLQIIEGVLGFMRNHLGHKVASTKLVEPSTRRFVAAIEQFVQDNAIPMICFNKGQRKDEVATRLERASRKRRGWSLSGRHKRNVPSIEPREVAIRGPAGAMPGS
jgi:hypothetical protein